MTNHPKFNPSTFLGCIPLSEFKNPPVDQVGCEIENCPACKQEMWVSQRKRKLRNEKKLKTICFFCLLDLMLANGINPKDVPVVDILKTS